MQDGALPVEVPEIRSRRACAPSVFRHGRFLQKLTLLAFVYHSAAPLPSVRGQKKPRRFTEVKRRGRNREEAECLLWGDKEDQSIAYRITANGYAEQTSNHFLLFTVIIPVLILMSSFLSRLSARIFRGTATRSL